MTGNPVFTSTSALHSGRVGATQWIESAFVCKRPRISGLDLFWRVGSMPSVPAGGQWLGRFNGPQSARAFGNWHGDVVKSARIYQAAKNLTGVARSCA
jgi:hypothetical protein